MTGLKPHPEYKASGVDWLGDIPAHWEMVKLKNGFDLQKRPVIKSAGIVTAFRDGQVTLRSNRRIDGYTEGDKQIGYQTIHSGDLVIHAMDAFAGAIGVSDSLGQSTPVYSACTPKPGFNAHFYARALRHIALTGYISSLAKGVRERSTDFRWADAKELPIPKPPLEEQNNIVSFLDRETAQIDDLIGKQERLINLLAEKRQALITHAVTKGLDPTAPTKPSGIPWLGDIPTAWNVSKLNWQSKGIGDGLHGTPTYSDTGSIPFVNGTNLLGDSIRITDSTNFVEEDQLSSADVSLDESTVLMSINGTVGNCAVLGNQRVMLSKSAAYIKCSESLHAQFLAHYLRSYPTRSYFVSASGGTTIANLSLATLRGTPVPVPPFQEQMEVTTWLDEQIHKLDGLRTKSLQAIELLRERRSALISVAVTGKIDVTNEGVAA
ncbi:type I restriction enzyme S subunit [Arthrobacter pascens]|uniref:restriction endonuclease subunit S n=1 Tax=Arthrobacter pascens TaxID=1677 RepID=UPI002784C222|nr:restriction endonuclease subunit S [Arthrobacter pascens]MDQ0632403.1 type I restriction enzyme S subunit [Arthrobacter pascens]